MRIEHAATLSSSRISSTSASTARRARRESRSGFRRYRRRSGRCRPAGSRLHFATPEFGQHLARQLGCRPRPIPVYDPFQLPVAKGFAGGIFGLGHADGVEQETVGWLRRHGACGIPGIRLDPKQQAVTFDARSRRAAHLDRRRAQVPEIGIVAVSSRSDRQRSCRWRRASGASRSPGAASSPQGSAA